MKLSDIKNNLDHDEIYSNYACKNKDALRFNEEKEDIRPPFLHDSDKIIYSLAYTRYINKTQVYSLVDNDNISKRMTHVQMVSKIARTIGRALGLNEDLIEAASLGHDLGHTPLGHVGESILNKISLEVGEGYFNHNIQSVRNLMFIENRGNGSNITLQVLDAIMCHNGELELELYKPIKKTKEEFLKEYYDSYKYKDKVKELIPMTLEGCVVRISDLIAYLGRDVEDAIRLGKLKRSDIPSSITNILGNTNSSLINTFVLDIISNSTSKYIKMSKEKFAVLKELKKFNYENIYNKANDKDIIDKWENMFRVVFNYYLNDLENKNIDSNIYIYFYKYKNDYYKNNTSLKRVVIDYIAGMTDEFFIKEYKNIIRRKKDEKE